MDPGSGAAIGLGVLFILSIIALVAVSNAYTKVEKVSGAPGFGERLADFFSGITPYFTTWFSLVPYAIFLAGPIADVFSSQLLYTKASLIGLAAIILTAGFGSNLFARVSNSIVGFLPPLTKPDIPGAWNPLGISILAGLVIAAGLMIGLSTGLGNRTVSTAVPPIGGFILLILLAGYGFLGDTVERYVTEDTSTSFAGITIEDACSTPGLGILQTSFAPVGILLESSILFAHFFEYAYTGNNRGMSITGGILAGTFTIETAVLFGKGCMSAYKSGKAAPFISLALGALFGLAGYNIMRSWFGEGFTTTQDEGVFHPPPAPEKKATSVVSDKKIFVGPQPETSEPVDDQDAFVCEAYKDGELITSTLVE